MPIYEYLCGPCNRIYSFLSATYNPTKTPSCPRCGATELTRQISSFAFVRGGSKAKAKDTPPSDLPPHGEDFRGGEPDPLDDPRIEREMMKLMSQAEDLDENDPRQLGRFMRRMSELTGEPLEGELEEAVRRLELGEDPDKIEEDLGDVMGVGDMDGGYGSPSYDDGLYPM